MPNLPIAYHDPRTLFSRVVNKSWPCQWLAPLPINKYPDRDPVISHGKKNLSHDKKIPSLLRGSLESVVLIWRSCAIESYCTLDTITLILPWYSVVRAILDDNIRKLDVVARRC